MEHPTDPSLRALERATTDPSSDRPTSALSEIRTHLEELAAALAGDLSWRNSLEAIAHVRQELDRLEGDVLLEARDTRPWLRPSWRELAAYAGEPRSTYYDRWADDIDGALEDRQEVTADA